MSTLFLTISFAVLALVIAVIPVLVGSVKGNRLDDQGGSSTIDLTARELTARELTARELTARELTARELTARETSRWHSHLGRRTRRIPRHLAPDDNSTVASGLPR